MKKFFCLVLVLFSAAGIFAQGKVIEKSEFDAVMTASYAGMIGQSFRETASIQSFSKMSGRERTSVIKTVSERIVGKASRYVQESRIRKLETVIIDAKLYTRKNDGKWEVKDYKPDPRPFENVTVPPPESLEYRALGTEMLDGQTTDVYLKIEKRYFGNESPAQKTPSTITTKYWFRPGGMLIKQEHLMESVLKSPSGGPDSIFRHLRIATWELDPTIKIEAPPMAN